MLKHGALILSVIAGSACSGPIGGPGADAVPGPTPAVARTSIGDLPDIDVGRLLADTTRLASDAFEGRAPGGPAEARTVEFLTSQFRSIGLQPGNLDGTFVQKVPLMGITSEPAPLVVTRGQEQLQLAWRDEVVAVTRRMAEVVSLTDSELVFVGYGVVAPEYGWDDYKGLDVTGKTLVMLVNDPPVADASDPSGLDPQVFSGRGMTYYGRWTYKYEIAAEKGAAAVLLVHETEPAGYPFDVVQASWSGEQFDLVTPDRNMGRVAVEGWIPVAQARRLLSFAGREFDDLKRQAVSRDFKPEPLGVTASMTLRSALRTIDSRNVVAKLEGRDAALKDTYVAYVAHWDHLGIGDPIDGDGIYNGAVDNAVGVAGLLEIARAFAALPEPPKRSILFLAVTAEEQGLLGSKYYATHPIHPLAATAAVVNIDTLNIHGRTRDMTIVGYGASDLDDYVREAAGEQGRVIRPDPEPEKGFFYRSDHFSFAKEGVPALDPDAGVAFVGRPDGFGDEMRRAYTERDYHKPSDEVRDDWDLTGAREDLKVLFAVGFRVAENERLPEWRSGSEFRARREESLKAGN